MLSIRPIGVTFDTVIATDRLPESESIDANAFGLRMLSVVNDAAIALLLGIGHQTCQFDRMSTLGFATSAGIASAVDLDERYVREWLGAMVCASIVDPVAGNGCSPAIRWESHSDALDFVNQSTLV